LLIQYENTNIGRAQQWLFPTAKLKLKLHFGVKQSLCQELFAYFFADTAEIDGRDKQV